MQLKSKSSFYTQKILVILIRVISKLKKRNLRRLNLLLDYDRNLSPASVIDPFHPDPQADIVICVRALILTMVYHAQANVLVTRILVNLSVFYVISGCRVYWPSYCR